MEIVTELHRKSLIRSMQGKIKRKHRHHQLGVQLFDQSPELRAEGPFSGDAPALRSSYSNNPELKLLPLPRAGEGAGRSQYPSGHSMIWDICKAPRLEAQHLP